jgi:hypothetical protein
MHEVFIKVVVFHDRQPALQVISHLRYTFDDRELMHFGPPFLYRL